MRYLLLPLLFVTLLASASFAQSPANGSWSFVMNSPMGSVTAKVELQSDGEGLTGSFDLGTGTTWPIEKGAVKEDQISFALNRPGASMTYDMVGTIKGDTITGQAHAMGATVDWTMTRVKGALRASAASPLDFARGGPEHRRRTR